MSEIQIVSNPFELMLNPEAVLQAVERSQRLEGLHRRIYRPLDKPLIAKKPGAADTTPEDLQIDLSDDDLD